ncbi:MAG: Glu/Leu/Phe/Val dehydrogenase [Halanaerobiales bacterium]|nr:Glu/Leu/Phe/Val dehydrogenase [Halanaerobiales bacterium]
MSNVFKLIEKDEFEEIAYGYDKKTGLKSIVAIHDTTLGPAFGGTRMMLYDNEEDALKDCLKLARAMTYKNAAANINFGGGKAVIIADSKTQKDEALLRAYGRFIDGLAGRFIAGVDVGTDENDMVIVQQETDHVTALPTYYGGAGSTSGATAYGVYQGMKKAAEIVFDNPNLTDKSVSIQGAGNIGYRLADFLTQEGAEVYITDIDESALQKASENLDVKIVEPESIYELDVDIFAPCALGAILNDETIPKLKCELIAGSANNQLKDVEKHSEMLKKRNIVYGVDYILSAGGVINNSQQYNPCGYNKEAAYQKVAKIGDTMKKVIEIAQSNDITTCKAAKMFAEDRLELSKRLNKWYIKAERGIKV